MAQVSISVGGIDIGIEDEDATAKSLRRLAVSTIKELVLIVGTKVEEEGEDG